MATGRAAGAGSDEDGGGWPNPVDGPQGRTDQPPTGRSRPTAAILWLILLVAALLTIGYAIFTWTLARPDADAGAAAVPAAVRAGRAA